jgi:hypothetical protein
VDQIVGSGLIPLEREIKNLQYGVICAPRAA